MVVMVKISNCLVRRVLIDRGSAVEIMFYTTFKQIGLPNEEIVLVSTLLVGFDGASMVSMETIRLEVTTREKLLMIEFVIINTVSPYVNVIMGRGWIHSMRGVPSSLH